MSSCSVVMVSYHTGPVLFASVKTVLKQSLLSELIIVDNGNPPDVMARLQQMSLTEPRLKLLRSEGNVGYARASNLGAREATGEYLFLLNPDCLLPHEALSSMLKGFTEVPGAVLIGAVPQYPDGSISPDIRYRMLTPEAALSEIFKPKRGPAGLTSNVTHEVASVPGSLICMRTQDYYKIGGLDEAFFLHTGELDLSMRVQRAGGRVAVVPRVKVTHMPGPLGKIPAPIAEWKNTKGLMRYFHKHFGGDYINLYLWFTDAALIVRFVLRSLRKIVARQIMPVPAMYHKPATKRLMILASGLAELPERKDWHGKTVLITGATSQVGLCVIRRLLASGAAVLAISRSDAIPFEHEHLRWIKGDLTDKQLHLEGYLVDMVVHCAPLWHLPPTINLLAEAEVKRIVAFGSTSIFGKAMSRNPHEKALVDRLAKAEQEIAENCRAKNIDWTILRPTLIYGVGLDLNVTSLAKFINRFGFFPIYPPAQGRRHPVHADDLALAVLQAANTPATYGKAYNVSGSEVLTYREMLERLFSVCRKRVRIYSTTLLPFIMDMAGKLTRRGHINGEIARRMNDDLVFFHDDAKNDFGFHPRAFLSGGMKDLEGF